MNTHAASASLLLPRLRPMRLPVLVRARLCATKAMSCQVLRLLLASSAFAGIPLDRVPAFAIPRMSTPPKLDGTIDPTEWREAVAIGGTVDQSTDIT
jgi:hypothetical protein